MECVDMALKSSFRPEFLVKTAQPYGIIEEFWPVNGGQTGGGGAGDDFFVDGLLDFSKDDGFVEDIEKEEVDNGVSQPENEKDVIPNVAAVNFSENGSVSVSDSEICVPADDVADLEWLSHFVDDSSPGYSLAYPLRNSPEKPMSAAASPLIAVPVNPSPFITPVQTKARRSKRTRTGGRVWSLGSPSLTDSSTSSSSSSSCTSNPWLIYTDFSQTAESLFGKPPIKKPKRKTAAENGGSGQQPRRCSHCLVQKTPQWRTGPLGAKTLCNACGVRFKSGRLLPEYRPACSPTFSSEVHSNNHRKVLEMRWKKEVETGLGQSVDSVLIF